MKKVVIVAAKRTAIGSFCGSLSQIPAPQLGALVIENLVKETKLDPLLIDEVIIGNVLTAGLGQNPARQAVIFAGLDEKTPATTINQVCGSGLKAVIEGYRAILSGSANIVIAGGQENMSLAPHLLKGLRTGIKAGNTEMQDSMILDGLTDVYNKYHMGITAENVANQYKLTREDLDNFAFKSQQKAIEANNSGRFNAEIVPVIVNQKTMQTFDKDEFIRTDISLDKLAKLRPAFAKDGVVTAGNSSGINDGAAMLILASEEKALELGLPILAYIDGEISVGLDPSVMGLGSGLACKKLLDKLNLQVSDIDIFELNEAFAAQAIAVNKMLGINEDRVNPNGGAIALGHPIGASGCRILVTLLHELKNMPKSRGVAGLCIGGGMGVALAISTQ